jgi:hypothetical protein
MSPELPAFVSGSTVLCLTDLGRKSALLMSYESSVADAEGSISSASRFTLMRLFQAFGGAVAVVSDLDAAVVNRNLGLPHLPLIGGAVKDAEIESQLDTLCDSPPFRGRHLIFCGALGAKSPLPELVLRKGGVFAGQDYIHKAVDIWLDHLAPMPVASRARA